MPRAPALLLAALFLLTSCELTKPVLAFDHGFPKDTERSKFFQLLKRPDKYPDSCCGEADAYEADTYTRNKDGSYDVVITEGSEIQYEDGTYRPEIPNGSKIHVPENKINPPVETSHNPTGHAWLFVSVVHPIGGGAEPGLVYCYAPLPEGS